MHKRSFGWIAIKIHNKIKYLKVPTYVGMIQRGGQVVINLMANVKQKVTVQLPKT